MDMRLLFNKFGRNMKKLFLLFTVSFVQANILTDQYHQVKNDIGLIIKGLKPNYSLSAKEKSELKRAIGRTTAKAGGFVAMIVTAGLFVRLGLKKEPLKIFHKVEEDNQLGAAFSEQKEQLEEEDKDSVKSEKEEDNELNAAASAQDEKRERDDQEAIATLQFIVGQQGAINFSTLFYFKNVQYADFFEKKGEDPIRGTAFNINELGQEEKTYLEKALNDVETEKRIVVMEVKLADNVNMNDFYKHINARMEMLLNPGIPIIKHISKAMVTNDYMVLIKLQKKSAPLNDEGWSNQPDNQGYYYKYMPFGN